MSISAIIVAAGSGSRFGGDVPKQYLDIGGQKVIECSIQAFISHPDIDNVVVVVSEKHKALYTPISYKYAEITVVIGGAERSDSVKAGLSALKDKNVEKILIHDAARPFISNDVIDRVIGALNDDLAVVPVVSVADTLKTGGDYVERTVDRSTLNSVQTPQGFCYKTLVDAYSNLLSFTDDAQAMEILDVPVRMVDGDEILFKITTPQDYALAESVVKKYKRL